MKYLKLSLLIVIIMLNSQKIFSQSSRSDRFIEKGDRFYNKAQYEKAAKYYYKALRADSNNAKANLYVGIELLESQESWKALPYIAKAYSLDPEINSQKDLYMGLAYQHNQNYSTAIEYFLSAKDNFRSYLKDERELILSSLNECKNAIMLQEEGILYDVENLGSSINSPFREQAPVATEMELFFASNRRKGKKAKDYFTDVYIAQNANGTISTDEYPLNSKYDDIVLSISPNGDMALLHSYKNNGDIYISKLVNGEWLKSESISKTINSPLYTESGASWASDGNAIYFTSNRPGGYGGFDIYSSTKLADGSWSTPKNLGPSINTKEDEETPFMSSANNILFFSSKGHLNIGGFDIYYSILDNETWSNPINMGPSVNTPKDDLSFIIAPDSFTGYYSAIKPDSYGNEDIYKVKFSLNGRNENLYTVLKSKLTPENDLEKIDPMDVALASLHQNNLIGLPVLRNLYFELNKKELSTTSLPQLNEIVKFMAKYKHAQLELSGHTDDLGSAEYNLRLSYERANSVFQYLVDNGVAANRITIVGLGKTIPLATNDDELEGRELNRRVEFNISLLPEPKDSNSLPRNVYSTLSSVKLD